MPRLCKWALKTLKCLCWSFLENNLSSFTSLNTSTLLSVIVGDSFANNCPKKGLHKEDKKISACLSMMLMIGATICCTGKVVGDGNITAILYSQQLHRQEWFFINDVFWIPSENCCHYLSFLLWCKYLKEFLGNDQTPPPVCHLSVNMDTNGNWCIQLFLPTV